MRLSRIALTLGLCLGLSSGLSSLLASCGSAADGDAVPRLVYVTNGVDPFWTIAAAGVRDAAEEYGVECDVQMPDDGTSATQKRIVEDMLARGVDGIAISPVDGENLTALIDEAASYVPVITHDSDAPRSKRLCYVGMDNYTAGWACGEMVREALPDGGSVMLFVGRLEQDNARQRRQGVIDAVLGRDPDPDRYDPPGSTLEGDGYTILGTRTDGFDQPRAKDNAEDALARHPDLGCMVGLFAYNPPACLEALRAAGRLGVVKVVAFDEDDATLQGILDGHVLGTITQQPYEYGAESVRILAGLVRGDESVLPEGGSLEVPIVPVRAANAEAFRKRKAELLERGR